MVQQSCHGRGSRAQQGGTLPTKGENRRSGTLIQSGANKEAGPLHRHGQSRYGSHTCLEHWRIFGFYR